MKRYSQLTIIQKINFKSYCINTRITRYGKAGIYKYGVMMVDGIFMDTPLYSFEFDKTYDTRY